MRKGIVLFFLAYGLFFLFVFTPMFVMSFDYLNQRVLHPAMISYKFDCIVLDQIMEENNYSGYDEVDFEEIEIDGYRIGGYYDQDTEDITLFNYDITTIKHEVCHAIQQEEGREHYCGEKVYGLFNGVLLDEIECYWKQNFMEDVNLSEYGFDIVGSIEFE